MSQKTEIRTDKDISLAKCIPISFQHLFAMVGGLVVAPLIIGVDPSTTMFCSGLGTLLYLLITKFKVPIFLCTSFAYTAPIILAREKYGVSGMIASIISSGIVYVIVALLVKVFGYNWIKKLMPPIVVGSVLIVIGLSSALVAVGWAGYNPTNSDIVNLCADAKMKWIIVSTLTFLVGIVGTTCFKGAFSVVPILLALIVGYISSFLLGILPIQTLTDCFMGKWIVVPQIHFPTANWEAAILTVPIALVTVGEHIADISAVGAVCEKDFISEPGLHRSILGDGLATVAAGLFGGPPNTTYSENIGIMSLTKVCSVKVVGAAATLAMIISFFSPINQFIVHIPTPVLGGVSMLLFGVIAISGINIFMQSGVDFLINRNSIIASSVIVLGLGGAVMQFTVAGVAVEIPAIAIATATGVLLNLFLPLPQKNS